MVNVFSGIASDFEEMIQKLGDELMSGFNKGVRSATTGTTADAPRTMPNQDAQRGELLLRNYAESLVRYHHKRNIEPTDIEALTRGVARAENWLGSVDGYRPVFAEVTKRVDALLEVKTPPDVAHDLRFSAVQALDRSRLKDTPDLNGSPASGNLPEPRCGRFLDSEIIAIYW